MKTFKIILLTVIVLALAVGIFFYVQYETSLYKAVILNQQITAQNVDFIKYTFPKEVTAYNAKLEEIKATQK